MCADLGLDYPASWDCCPDVDVDLTTDLDEARELGEIDEDPPCGDFNDAASLALIRLAGDCGCEDAGEMSTLDLYNYIRECLRPRIKKVTITCDALQAVAMLEAHRNGPLSLTVVDGEVE